MNNRSLHIGDKPSIDKHLYHLYMLTINFLYDTMDRQYYRRMVKDRGIKMKKAFAVVMCLVLCLAIVGCGGNFGSNEPKDNPKIAAYVKELQPQVVEMNKTFEPLGLSVSVEVKGNSLAYSLKYTTEIYDKDVVAKGLEKELVKSEDNFKAALADLRIAVPETESVILTYYAKDGSKVYSREYK